MFINIGIQKTQSTYNSLFWFRYETFIYLFESKVFRHEERETQFLSMLTFPSDPHHVRPLPQTTGLALASSENRLPSSSIESQLSCLEFKSQLFFFCFFFFFFSNSKIFSSSGHDVISYLGFLLWHLWLSHPPRARMNTCTQCVHLTNPCTKWKVLSLTKPKGKIYKMKSLRNYITHGTIWLCTNEWIVLNSKICKHCTVCKQMINIK